MISLMIRVKDIKVEVIKDSTETLKKKLEKIIARPIRDIKIIRKSIDARNKKQIFYVYTLDIEIDKEEEFLAKNKNNSITKAIEYHYEEPQYGQEKLDSSIVIVGSGPAGLFAAYLLTLKGFKPIIIERGEMIDSRVKKVQEFWENGKLDEDSNVQFGEGGAGTFSDGKLNTLSKEAKGRGNKVLEVFVEFGAPKEILYLQHPHIGTDILRDVVKNMRDKIISLGGEFRYKTKLTDLIIENNKLEKIIVNNTEEIKCNNLILAIGHSARDTFLMLYNHGLKLESKDFAMGVRIMHDQQMINNSQYGDYAKYLPNANYKLTYTTKEGRGVYSFCMCPGGYVVNASSEANRLTINGMSNYKRDSGIANSAIVVQVTKKDFGDKVLDGMEFQRKLEAKTYEACQGKIPMQTWKDFKLNRVSQNLGEVIPQVKGKYCLENVGEILPKFITEAIKEAMPNFDKKIEGFAKDDALICALEARTSSPIRIVRDNNMESSIKGIYPIGEGSGYTGGITTSAIDGLKVAEVLTSKYQKID